MTSKSANLVDFIIKLKSEGATDKDIKTSYDRYIEIYARENKIPLSGKFELTPLCNLDCKMCYVHLHSSQLKESSLLSVNSWKHLMSEAHKAGMIYSTLTGGECLTYPGFDELYLFLRKIGSIPCVMTNGLLLDKDRINFFQKYPPNLIQVTLYGSSDNAYEKVTGHRVFNTIYHNLEQLRDSNLRIRLTLTPSLFMYDDIRPLLEMAKSLSIPYGINANLIAPRENTGREICDLDIDSYMEIYRIWKDLNQEKIIPVDEIDLPDENKDGQALYGFQCGGGRSSFTIQYNGKMSPCPSMGEITTDPVEDGFINAWRQLNDLVNNYPMPAECNSCIYHDYCILCPAIHKNANNPGHRNTSICNRTKRLIQEGFIKLPDDFTRRAQ